MKPSEPDESELDRPACNLCGSRDARIVHDLPPYAIVECRRCKLAYTSPRPSVAAMADHYDENFFEAYEQDATIEGTREFTRRWLKRLATLTEEPMPWRILEVGAGIGWFSAEALAQGHTVISLEPSAHAVAYSRQRFGLSPIQAGAQELSSLHLDQVDVAVMLASIEHLSDPLDALRQIHSVLQPNGLLLVSTGVWRCLNHRLAGTKWTIIAPVGHFYYFSKKTIRAELAAAGFDTLHLETNGYIINVLTNSPSLVWLFNNKVAETLGVHKMCTALRLGDEMFVVARRV